MRMSERTGVSAYTMASASRKAGWWVENRADGLKGGLVGRNAG